MSNLKFEIRTKERKVRTPKGNEPANGGADDGNLKSEISFWECYGRRQVQQKTDQPSLHFRSQIWDL